MPDNPEAWSQQAVVFDKGIDPLTYCWEVTTDVCALAQAIVKHLPGGDWNLKSIQVKGILQPSMALDFRNISAEVPIIGFTGALGSGCTFIAKQLAKDHRYAYYSLSAPIHEEVRRKGLKETSENLQDVGNRMRLEKGLDYLVMTVLAEAEKNMPPKGDAARLKGIIIDGIRNTGEVDALRQWSHFYLISIQADQETRKQRLKAAKRCTTDKKFTQADRRDAEENTPYGQQVKRCNFMSPNSVELP